MTNQEYTKSLVSKFGISELDIERIFLDHNIEPNEAANAKAIKRALYNEFSILLPLQNANEGGLSISWNLEAIRIWYALLCKELGKKNMVESIISKNKVRDITHMFRL